MVCVCECPAHLTPLPPSFTQALKVLRFCQENLGSAIEGPSLSMLLSRWFVSVAGRNRQFPNEYQEALHLLATTPVRFFLLLLQRPASQWRHGRPLKRFILL